MPLNAFGVYDYIDKINSSGFGADFGMSEENAPLLQRIYDLAKEVVPYDQYRNGTDRAFWLSAPKGTYEEYSVVFKSRFTKSYDLTHWYLDKEAMERQWPVMFPRETCWFRLYLAEHEGNRGLSINKHRLIDTTKTIHEKMDMAPLLEWILSEEENAVRMIEDGTYLDYLNENLPYQHRSGVVVQEVFWKYVPQTQEWILENLDMAEFEEFKSWDASKDIGLKAMTTGDYFRCCDILYELLGLKDKFPLKDKNPSPKYCYKAYSDGRDSGSNCIRFRDLDQESPEEFERWVDAGMYEDHVWEFCQVPLMFLIPKKIKGSWFYYLNIYRLSQGEYGQLIHLELELRKRGFPVLKSLELEKKVLGKQLIKIIPHGDEWDWRYAEKNGIKTEDSDFLPSDAPEELIRKIEWFPLKLYENTPWSDLF